MKNTKQVIALASAAALSVSVLAGCGGAASDATSESTSTATAEASNTAASDGTLVLAETGFEGKFSPFFASSASDQDDLHAKRQVFSYITKEDIAKKVIDEIGPKYADRNGGYTRIYKIGPRRGDAAEMAIIELV